MSDNIFRLKRVAPALPDVIAPNAECFKINTPAVRVPHGQGLDFMALPEQVVPAGFHGRIDGVAAGAEARESREHEQQPGDETGGIQDVAECFH